MSGHAELLLRPRKDRRYFKSVASVTKYVDYVTGIVNLKGITWYKWQDLIFMFRNDEMIGDSHYS